MNHSVETYWEYFGKRLVDLTGIVKGNHVLDVGTGGGSSLFPALTQIDQGYVVGMDISHECMRRTLEKLKKCNIPNATILNMDAKALAFKKNTFDIVISGFVGWDECVDFTNCTIIDTTPIEEMHRVLKPGGKVGLTSWALQEENELLSSLVRKYPTALTKIGEVPINYSKETAEGLEKMLYASGFENVKILTEKTDITYRDEEQWWTYMQYIGWSPYFKRIESTNHDTLKKFKEDVERELQKHKNGEIHFAKHVLYSFGEK